MPFNPLLICLLCLSLSTFGQKNFTAAYIVKNNGDSLNGTIDYRNWKKNPETIKFIGSSGQEEEFDPASVSGFYITAQKEKYISAEVSIDKTTDQYNTAYATQVAKDSFILKRVFLLQLIKSASLSLYQYNDGDRNNFYYTEGDGKPVGLIYHFIFLQSGQYLETVDTYKQQLQLLFSSCPKIASKTKNTIYASEPIKNLMTAYLACTNPSAVAEIKKEDHVAIKFGIVGGVMYNTFKFVGHTERNPNDYSTLGLDNYKSNMSPVIGVSMDVGFKRDLNRLHLVNELIYKQYVTSDTGFTHTVLYDLTNTVSFSFSYLQLNTMLRYYFSPGSSVKPFINAGIGNAVMIAERKNSNDVKLTNGNSHSSTAIKDVRKYELTPQFGAGVSIKNLVIEGRFAFSNGFAPFTTFKSKIKSYQVTFTYLLLHK
jgi:hypothetical protein